MQSGDRFLAYAPVETS